jgi:hypothetical protein
MCGPQNCDGCCRGNVCEPGTDVVNCGINGRACATCPGADLCTMQGATRSCQAPTACEMTCEGCCDANDQCQAGFLDPQCGQNGAACLDCQSFIPASTCDTNASPRVCTSQQNQCPSTYAGCPNGVMAVLPAQEQVCSAADLKNAAAACLGGAHTPGCQSFFQFEQSQNATCASCLSPFDFDFTELNGLIACLSPFVDPSCQRTLACLNDCENQTCNLCPESTSLQQCRTQVANSACSSFLSGATCIEPGFFGPGSFCSPAQGQFGDWLAAVGQHYCLQ